MCRPYATFICPVRTSHNSPAIYCRESVLNNKIRVIKRRCYGIFNVRHLFQRIFIDMEGYSLFGCRGEDMTDYYPTNYQRAKIIVFPEKEYVER
ncbi:MAG TPA: hypothetical protein DCQ37_02690 [Desulfobacteraceae bacterium]|nr:hypothetical protein [Desulfobacteraceae bacterium]